MIPNSVTKVKSSVLKYEDISQELVDGIKRKDSKIINRIYKMYFVKIKSMVGQFRLRHLQADDIFQEGLTRAFINIQNGSFKGGSTFYVYLYGICRNICLKESGKSFASEVSDQVPDYEDEMQFEIMNRLLVLRSKLETACREIIDLRFCQENSAKPEDKCMSFDDIAKRLGIQADNARQRFKRCLARLKELANKDLIILELLD